MTQRKDPINERFESLLREQVSSSAEDAVSNLVGDLRHAYVAPLPMEVQNRQIADLVIAGRQAGVTRPGPLRRRVNGAWYQFSQRFIAGSVVGKVVLAASVAAAATTGMAATGRLPDPMQIAISALAAQVGVSIPTPAPAPLEVGAAPEPPAPKPPSPLQVPAAGPSIAPPPAGVAGPQTEPVPTSQPGDSCDRVLSASPAPPPPGGGGDDVLAALEQIAGDQLELDELVRCLVPDPAAPPPPPSSGEGGSGDDLEELLRTLLGGGS